MDEYRQSGLRLIDIPIDELVPNPWNPNVVDAEGMAKIEASLNELDMVDPIKVRELPNGNFEIIGGQHRTEILRRRGETSVPAINLGAISDATAKKITLIDNGRYGHDDASLLGSLLKEIEAEVGSLDFLPYTDSDLKHLREVEEFDIDSIDEPAGYEDADYGDPLPTQQAVQSHTILRFKIPVDDTDRVQSLIQQTIAEHLLTDSDALTNAGDALMILLQSELRKCT